MSQAVAIRPIPFIDKAAQRLAWALSKFTQVTGAGVFRLHGGTAFVDLWRESSGQHSPGGTPMGSWTLRLGRVEFVADYRGHAPLTTGPVAAS